MSLFGRSLVLAALLALLAACAGPDDATKPVDPAPPSLPTLIPNAWTEVSPGGETVCSDGSPYAFYVFPGTVNKVVVDFQGGGACWNGGTCGEGGPYLPRVAGSPEALFQGNGGTPTGIYDKGNPKNPVGDWYHVFVSYCTADVHIGDSERVYHTQNGEKTVRHRGQRNVEAVLAWMFGAFEAPESIFVTGCSAGAYGAVVYTPRLAAHYRNAEITQLGDCGAGIIPESFVEEGLEGWNVQGALPSSVDLEGGRPATFLADTYVAIGRAYPESLLAQYNSALDGTQIAFYAAQQGQSLADPEVARAVGEDWLDKLISSLGTIAVGLDNFYAYTSLLDENNTLADGTAHCILWRPDLYTLETDGVPFVAWLGDLVNGRREGLRAVWPPFSNVPTGARQASAPRLRGQRP